MYSDSNAGDTSFDGLCSPLTPERANRVRDDETPTPAMFQHPPSPSFIHDDGDDDDDGSVFSFTFSEFFRKEEY